MQWLIANMWMALAAATVLGLLFGFSFRGLLVGSRVRRAEVEREIARTELTQIKAEVEALYAAQRKRKEDNAQAVGGDDGLQTELEERESRISALGSELAAARSELEQLKTENGSGGGVVETAGAAVAGAVAGAALSETNDEELTQLRDRNTWLEERVAALETDLAALPTAAAADVAPAPAQADPTLEKLKWQAGYLRQRVDALETSLISARVVESPAAAAPEEQVTAAEPATAESDEELARLRWRNRYLEGRLAYFEAGDAEATEDTTEAAEVAEPEPEPEAEPKPAAETSEADDAESDSEAPDSEPEAPEEDSEEVHPSEAMLAELEGEQPEQLEKPENGGDDLTAITGIGPRIGEVLNELGIFTYAQIAGWTPENETWIENHLSFKGRVSRENWVEQAKALMAE